MEIPKVGSISEVGTSEIKNLAKAAAKTAKEVAPGIEQESLNLSRSAKVGGNAPAVVKIFAKNTSNAAPMEQIVKECLRKYNPDIEVAAVRRTNKPGVFEVDGRTSMGGGHVVLFHARVETKTGKVTPINGPM